MDLYEKDVTSSLFKNYRTTLERIEKFISPIYFTDINLYGRLYNERLQIKSIFHVELPNNYSSKRHCPSQRPSIKEALQLDFNHKVNIGDCFGPTWTSHWFKLVITIPKEWLGKEIHLRWNSGSEALIWSQDGKPLQGLNDSSRDYFIVSKCLTDIQVESTYYIEMACNSLFGAGNGMINPPDMNKSYCLQMVEIAVFEREIYDVLMDLEILHDIAKELKDSNRAYQSLFTANQIINILNFSNKETLLTAHRIAKQFFSQKNGDSQLDIIAIGNCHIDSAWLWPYGETIRKCARSWSSTIRLLERPDLNMTFACSQAQQLFWVKNEYPSLFKEIQAFAKEGKFIPVGGTWVEMDGNIPSGESFIRQFLYGQKFFKEEFGKICNEFWLPDTFGYSAQIPQMMKICGAQYFVSQKLSWSLVNKFPHNTFIWEGIDGSNVIAHFPPANTYTSSVKIEHVLKTATNLSDKGRVSSAMLLYGHGDGGGGPDENICQRIKRLHDVDGIPRVKVGTPEDFFSSVEKCKKNLNRWVGELYLELHNGTYTTQALMKLFNRKCEFQLQQLDFLSSILKTKMGFKDEDMNIMDAVECLWKQILLNQFHDVLPGSSIKIVHDEALQIYKEASEKINNLCSRILNALYGDENENSMANNVVLFNSLSWERTELVGKELLNLIGIEEPPENVVALVKIPSMGYISLKDAKLFYARSIWEETSSGHFEIRNDYLKAVVDDLGRITSLYHLGCEKESIFKGSCGNQFIIYDDVPLYWDAWDVMDYHLETGKCVTEKISNARINPGKDVLHINLKLAHNSSLRMELSLPPNKPYLMVKVHVDWNESHKFLKVEFPVNVHSDKATYDIQFGHLQRSTHFNTSWDWAKYEVCGHKWIDLSEYNWGVAILNNCKYGHAVHKNVMRMSLLRSSKSPDNMADIGEHDFEYSIFPHSGTFQEAGVIKEAYIFNSPIITHKTSLNQFKNLLSYDTYFEVDHPAIVIETVKFATHVNNALVVRLYESFGGRCSANLKSNLPFRDSALCSGLEDEISQISVWSKGGLNLTFGPFEIKSVLLKW